MEFLKPEVFDGLVILNIIIGFILAGRRLYQDFTRPYPENQRSSSSTPQ